MGHRWMQPSSLLMILLPPLTSVGYGVLNLDIKVPEEEGGRGWDVRWHHGLSGHELKQIPGDSGGQGSLACYSPWACKESDTTV